MVGRGTEVARRAKESNTAQILRAIKNGLVECVVSGLLIKTIERGGGRGGPPALVAIASKAGGVQTVGVPQDHHAARRDPVARLRTKSIGVRFLSRPGRTRCPSSLRNARDPNVRWRFHHQRAGGLSADQAGDVTRGTRSSSTCSGDRVEPADHGVLQKKLGALRIAGGRVNVDQALAAIQQRLHVFRGVKPLGLRELRDRQPHRRGRSAGRTLLKSGDYSASIYNILDGEVHLYSNNERLMSASAWPGVRRDEPRSPAVRTTSRPSPATTACCWKARHGRPQTRCGPRHRCGTIWTATTSCAR